MSRPINHFAEDLKRYRVLGPGGGSRGIIRLFLYTPGLWILFWYRLGKPLNEAAKCVRLLKPLSALYNYGYFLLGLVTGISLPLDTQVGRGFYIGHNGGIFVHPAAIIGDYCNISQGVTIGEGGRDEKRGVPRIGDRVYIGPGAKIFGNFTIGNDAAIGANSVVVSQVSEMTVVGGIPAKIISDRGSKDFVIL